MVHAVQCAAHWRADIARSSDRGPGSGRDRGWIRYLDVHLQSQWIVNDNPVNHFWNDTQYQLDDISCTKWISLDDSSFSQATYGYINGVRFPDVDGECIYSWKDSYANLTYPLVI